MKGKLLLLHGALGSSIQFEAIAARLADSFEVLTLDFEGHGGREIARDYSIDHFTENVVERLQKEESVQIFGYSMGGYVALKAAQIIPEKIDKIITLGTKFDWSEEAVEREVKMLDPDKIEEKVPQFASMLSKTHEPQDWKEVMRQTAGMMKRLADGERLREGDLSSIRVETVIGIGDRDHMVSERESKLASELLANAKLVVLANVKHPLEQVDTTVLQSFLLEHLTIGDQ